MWSQEENSLHVNMMEMKALSLALAAFLPQLSGQSVVPMSNNAMDVAYLWHQGGTVCRVLCHMAAEVVLWTKHHLVSLMARYILGTRNVLADQFSHPEQVLPTEWSRLPRVFEGICWVFGCPHFDLFATRANAKLLLYIPLVPDLMAWKLDAFQHPWDHMSA